MNHNTSKPPVPPDTMHDPPAGKKNEQELSWTTHPVGGCEFLFDLAGET